jgi:hypothetical protein
VTSPRRIGIVAVFDNPAQTEPHKYIFMNTLQW